MFKNLIFLMYFFSPFIFFNNTIAQDQNEDVENLVSYGAQILKLNRENILAITFHNSPQWHTYWKNPGDAGTPIDIKFFANSRPLEFNALEWPYPERFIADGDIWGLGYTGDYALFFRLPPKLNSKFTIKGTWLVCKNVCISAKGEITGEKMAGHWYFSKNLNWDEYKLLDHYNSLPAPIEWPAGLKISLTMVPKQSHFSLDYEISDPNFFSQDNSLLMPFPHPPFGFAHEKLEKRKNGTLNGHMDLEWDGEYLEPPQPFPTDGKFQSPQVLKFLIQDSSHKKSWVIEKTFTSAEILTDKISNSEPIIEVNLSTEESTEILQKSLIYYMILAFLGGLILNLMPCVLPMISLKLFELISLRDSTRKQVLHKSLAYCSGVVASLLVLATVVVWLKTIGSRVGWGMQLQSPLFIASMIFILFLFSLNLFGLFEFSTPGGKFLGNFKIPEGRWGDFFSGIISTILSTPCSAPFLGTALAFAFTSSNITIFAIFFSISLGLSSPFIIVGFFPQILKFLPRPGSWMELLKKFLALALLLTVIWLIEVFLNQVQVKPGNFHIFTNLLLCLVFCFFAFLMKRAMPKMKSVSSFFFFLSIFYFYFTAQNLTKTESSVAHNQITWEKWSPEALTQLQKDKKTVFMDFTASWCLNCKVNEKLVLHTNGFQEFAKENQIVLLEADWTSYDPIISDWLKSHHVFAVPAYFVQKPDGEIISLGETISINKIKTSLNE